MASFKDCEGIEWAVDVTVDTIRRVRSVLDIDLMQAAGGDVLERLGADPVELVDVLWLICEEQAGTREVTDETFGRRLKGDAIEAATDALIVALIDFFPPRLRKHLEAIWAKQREAHSKLDSVVSEKINGPKFSRALDTIVKTSGQKMDEAIDAAIAKAEEVDPIAPKTRVSPSGSTPGS